jgi:MinD superfamily P-loop ATPase
VNLAIASGKGGTGKTTVAVNLAHTLGDRICLVDCDVEEPNAHLFLKGVVKHRETVTVPVPRVDPSRCDGCGDCGEFCEYNAIVPIKPAAIVFPELCHGCGGCMRVCTRGAITETRRRIGVVETMKLANGTLVQGRLDVGVPTAPPLIKAARASARSVSPASEPAFTILDAPPGTSCPVVTTLQGTDFVVLVTEPTPFGLYDLRLAVEMVRKLAIPFGVVVNRAGIGDGRVHEFCARERLSILQEIPDDRRIAEACSRGDVVVEVLPEYRDTFKLLLDNARLTQTALQP